METQFVSINFISYNTGLLKYIRFFRIRPLKKRSKKEQGPFSGTFWKIFFFQVSFLDRKKRALTLKNLQHLFDSRISYDIASYFFIDILINSWSMWLFFFGQSQKMDQFINTYDHNESHTKIFLKNLKKTCFQNGNTICEHNF